MASAYTCVIAVITPLGDAASFVQVTLIATDLLNAPAGSHVLVKLSATGVGALTIAGQLHLCVHHQHALLDRSAAADFTALFCEALGELTGSPA